MKGRLYVFSSDRFIIGVRQVVAEAQDTRQHGLWIEGESNLVFTKNWSNFVRSRPVLENHRYVFFFLN